NRDDRGLARRPDQVPARRHRSQARRGRGIRRDRGRGGRRPVVSRPAMPREVALETPVEPASPLSLDDVQKDPAISAFIASADRVMEGLGFTEHGFRHANLTARIAFNVLTRLGHGEREGNLACIAGYVHDVGNMVTREAHGQTGAVLIYDVLKGRMATSDLA